MKEKTMEQVKLITNKILAETSKIIVGKNRETQLLLMGILSNGHILIDDVPGTGKTTLVKALSFTLGLEYKRVQFVSDLMPTDILGLNIFNQKTCEFEFKQGPIFTQILLADEVNRATSRTQSALLEAMEERQITIDGACYRLPKPFIVIATQNPIEKENTFKLPLAQLDRFSLSVSLGYPSKEDEMNMLKINGDGIDFNVINRVTDSNEILRLQSLINNVYVSEAMYHYIINLIDATRFMPELSIGGSPRATKSLYKLAKARAAMEGRDFITPDDVQFVAFPVLQHRLRLSTMSKISNEKRNDLIMKLLERVEIVT